MLSFIYLINKSLLAIYYAQDIMLSTRGHDYREYCMKEKEH